MSNGFKGPVYLIISVTNPCISEHVPCNLLYVNVCLSIGAYLCGTLCLNEHVHGYVFQLFSTCVCREAVSFSLVVSIIRSLPLLFFMFFLVPSFFFSKWSFPFASLSYFHLHPSEWWACDQSFIFPQWRMWRNHLAAPPILMLSVLTMLSIYQPGILDL